MPRVPLVSCPLKADCPFMRPVGFALKRTEFVTLNTSQANLTFCLSVILKFFVNPESILKMPSPRKLFRVPASPGYGRRIGDPPFCTPELIESASAKACGTPFSRCLWSLTGPVTTPKPSISQLVDQPGAYTKNGRPLVQRLSPDHCQPPMKASASRLTPPPKRCP